MDGRDRFLAGIGAQLEHPRGLTGRFVGRMLNQRNKRAITAAVDSLAISPGAALADLGFGGGLGLDLLLRRIGDTGRVHGIDLSSTMLDAASRRFRHEIRRGRLQLHHAPIERMPLDAESIDGAITVNTIYFVADLGRAFDTCARVLKPNGRLVIGCADPDRMARKPLTDHGFRVRTIPEITAALLDAGLNVTEHRRVGEGTGAFHLLVTELVSSSRRRG